jgi:hypothetical protein
MLVVAVDWSGAKGGGRRDIAVAVSERGTLQAIHTGLHRDEVAEWLLARARAVGHAGAEAVPMVVGLDFAFSFPLWFLRHQGLPPPPALWDVIAGCGEEWLTGEAPWPFWGRSGDRKRIDVGTERALRVTDRDAALRERIAPKSVFQLVGSGQVGPGSIRGMPILARLHRSCFRVWPFATFSGGGPLAVEIYPRLLTGAVAKRNRASREAHLPLYGPQPPALLEQAASTEHAFDAACSALVMDRFHGEFGALRPDPEPYGSEGRMWVPASPAFRSAAPLPPR